MTLLLYKNSAENNRVDKTLYLDFVTELQGTIRNSTSIISPVITIEYDGSYLCDVIDDNNNDVIDDNEIETSYIRNIYLYNYAYIPELSRYYYITEIVCIGKNLYELYLTCDVLMSFKNDFLNLDCLVSRNQFESNPLIVDEKLFTKYKNDISEYDLENGNKVDTVLSLNNLEHNVIIVLDYVLYTSFTYHIIDGVAVRVQADGSDIPKNNISSNNSVLRNISYDNYKNSSGTQLPYMTLVTDMDGLIKLSFELQDTPSALSQIYNITILPFNVDVTDDLLFFDTPCKYLKYPNSYHTIADFKFTMTNWFDYEPYSKYELFIPYFGWTTLNANQISNNRILVVYTIDYMTSHSLVYIIDDTNNRLLFIKEAQLGIKYDLITTNSYEVNKERASIATNAIFSMLASSVGGIGIAKLGFDTVKERNRNEHGRFTKGTTTTNYVTAENPLGLVGGAIGVGGSLAKAVTENDKLYVKSEVTLPSGASSLLSPYKCRYKKTTMSKLFTGSDIDNYAKYYGLPLNAFKKLNEVVGYTEVEEIHLENLSTATSNEKQAIEEFLKSGVIL